MPFDAFPSGVRLIPAVLRADQEMALAHALETEAWSADVPQRQAQFGWQRPTSNLSTDPSDANARFLGALPDWVVPLVRKLHVLAAFDYAPDHLMVRDIRAGDPAEAGQAAPGILAQVVLHGDLPMRYRKRSGPGSWALTQPRGSALVLTERFSQDWDRQIGPLPCDAATDRVLCLSFRRFAQS